MASWSFSPAASIFGFPFSTVKVASASSSPFSSWDSPLYDGYPIGDRQGISRQPDSSDHYEHRLSFPGSSISPSTDYQISSKENVTRVKKDEPRREKTGQHKNN